jgi:hypothetical protein
MMTNIGRNPNIASLLGDFMRDTELFEEIIFEEKVIETGKNFFQRISHSLILIYLPLSLS